MIKEIALITEQNTDLRKRIETLELLVAHRNCPQQQIDYLAEEILKLKATAENQ
ncbi:MAG: hypothetical protein RMJ89_13145 [Flammeovirgaceae bacterium]|nr:hypothetical protein [Flammeovirgaceae bacterium]